MLAVAYSGRLFTFWQRIKRQRASPCVAPVDMDDVTSVDCIYLIWTCTAPWPFSELLLILLLLLFFFSFFFSILNFQDYSTRDLRNVELINWRSILCCWPSPTSRSAVGCPNKS